MEPIEAATLPVFTASMPELRAECARLGVTPARDKAGTIDRIRSARAAARREAAEKPAEVVCKPQPEARQPVNPFTFRRVLCATSALQSCQGPGRTTLQRQVSDMVATGLLARVNAVRAEVAKAAACGKTESLAGRVAEVALAVAEVARGMSATGRFNGNMLHPSNPPRAGV